MTHPLKRAYNDAIRKEYGIKLWGDKAPERTDIVAQRVDGLGIPYGTFITLALAMWDDWAQRKGHSYPFWNVVTSDQTFDRLKRYLSLTRDAEDDGAPVEQFAGELEFALSYIRWLGGENPEHPERPTSSVSIMVKISVAEYICRLYGIPCVTSDYAYIAGQIAGRRDG